MFMFEAAYQAALISDEPLQEVHARLIENFLYIHHSTSTRRGAAWLYHWVMLPFCRGLKCDCSCCNPVRNFISTSGEQNGQRHPPTAGHQCLQRYDPAPEIRNSSYQNSVRLSGGCERSAQFGSRIPVGLRLLSEASSPSLLQERPAT